MAKLRKIEKGDTISVIAPANSMSSMPRRLIQMGVRRLKALGYGVEFGRNTLNKGVHGVDHLENRLTDFHRALENPRTAGIMAVFGGYNSSSLLDQLDYRKVVSARKLIIGYSDITALLNGIHKKTGLKTLHGVSFANFCDPNMFEATIQSFLSILAGESGIELTAPPMSADDAWYLKNEFGPRDPYRHPGWIAVRQGHASGKMVGGNLETLLALAGTPYFPEFKDHLLLIENGEKTTPGEFVRQMTQLGQMGVLSSIRGLIVGQFPRSSCLSRSDIAKVIVDRMTRRFGYPCIINANFSHVDPIYSIPIGARTEIQATSNKVIIRITESIYH